MTNSPALLAHVASPPSPAARRRGPTRGFTLIELMMVVIVAGIMMAVALPKFRIAPTTEVQLAAMQLTQDLDLVRTRALSTRSTARVAFVSSARNYTGYLDTNADGVFGQTIAERDALRGFATRTLPVRVDFGRGNASSAPGDAGSTAITFSGAKVEFDSRGLTFPMGTGGAVYLRHSTDASAVAAIVVSPAGSVRLWTWRNGGWQ
jgi:prepilin-type N-terminal cleavage/methylation domain-containing protein